MKKNKLKKSKIKKLKRHARISLIVSIVSCSLGIILDNTIKISSGSFLAILCSLLAIVSVAGIAYFVLCEYVLFENGIIC